MNDCKGRCGVGIFVSKQAVRYYFAWEKQGTQNQTENKPTPKAAADFEVSVGSLSPELHPQVVRFCLDTSLNSSRPHPPLALCNVCGCNLSNSAPLTMGSLISVVSNSFRSAFIFFFLYTLADPPTFAKGNQSF